MLRALTPTSFALRLAPFALFALAALLVAPLIGNVSIDLGEAWEHRHAVIGNTNAAILWMTRVPRVLLAALVGGALALAGATFQALLRNPLAEPFTLGVSSGGAFGAVLAIKLGLGASVLGLSPVVLFALAGSSATIAVVYALARTRGVVSTNLLLLAGVTISFFFAAEILLVFYLADFTETHQMLRWMMGSLDVLVGPGVWTEPGNLVVGAGYLAGVAVLMAMAGALNQLSLGPELAASRGVNVRRAQKSAYLAASLLTGLVVALAGPIGFVGLIVPHAARFLIGPDHRVLLPASFFGGAGFLVVCDTVARSMAAGIEIPVGVLTATLGGPFFLALLLRAKRQGTL
jgi:ABC-type Fe3+-siderophore transport system permease subunit